MKLAVTHDVVFPAEAIADPVRREILERLATGDVGAGEIAAAFPISRPAVSRHLRVLREAGLVTSRIRGQQRIYALDRRPLAELDGWLERFRPLTTEDAGRGAARSPFGPDGPAARLDALDTEIRRGRRRRRAADQSGDGHARTDTAG
jgi:DNA-binding transcriptional ArsR family regulator